MLGPEVGAGLHAPRLRAQDLQVRLDHFANARALHLHRDRRAVGKHRAVYLPDARRGLRGLVELREELRERRAELGLDLLFGLLERERRHLVLQLGELGCEGGRDDVGPHREHLPDLRERRAEPLHRVAKALFDADRGGAIVWVRSAQRRHERDAQPQLVEGRAEPFVHENRDDLAVPLCTRAGCHRFGLCPKRASPFSAVLASGIVG